MQPSLVIVYSYFDTLLGSVDYYLDILASISRSKISGAFWVMAACICSISYPCQPWFPAVCLSRAAGREVMCEVVDEVQAFFETLSLMRGWEQRQRPRPGQGLTAESHGAQCKSVSVPTQLR